jgi:ribosome biogenesis GTPase A
LLPNRLAYPEHIPLSSRKEHIYEGVGDLKDKIKLLLRRKGMIRNNVFQEWVKAYNWREVISSYDDQFDDLHSR